MAVTIAALMGYGALAMLVGSVPTGYLVARLFGVDDITQHGSGAIGATNVARVISSYLFFLVLGIDAGKAALCMYLIPKAVAPFCIIMLMISNSHSIFLGNRPSGKGVATLLGILCVLAPIAAGVFVCAWLLALMFFRSVGIASVLALLSLIFSVYYCVPTMVIGMRIIAAALWSLYRHKEHIQRLQLQGIKDVF
jgi:glycerol-3-phosphate acyltransferase PlsY